jgi:uncharacterized membrane protein
MGWLSFLQKKPVEFFTKDQQAFIQSAVAEAEKFTSGEVRVYVESRCRFVDPLDRATEIFAGLKMDQTKDRNGVLVYVAMKDRQLAVFGDAGIHEKVGQQFWNTEVRKMLSAFNKENYAEGIATVVKDIGNVLSAHFPYDAGTDKNELPDDIVFGR